MAAVGIVVVMGIAIFARRSYVQWANRAGFAISVGEGRPVVSPALPPSDESARDGSWFAVNETTATLVRVSADNDQRRLGVDIPGSAQTIVTTMLPLDAERIAIAATTLGSDGRHRGHVGVSGSFGTRASASPPVDTLARDASGKIVAFVPCGAPSEVTDLAQWVNAGDRCLRTLDLSGSTVTVGAEADVCKDCRVQAAYAAGGVLRAWLLFAQRDSALVAVESGRARELMRPQFHTGPGYVNAVAWAQDGGSAAVGDFSGRLDVGGETLSTAGGADAFVLVTDAAGQVRFARRYGDARLERAVSATFLTNGDLRVLVQVHGDVSPGWLSRALAGRAATADTLEILELDPTGATRTQRRYAVAPPRDDERVEPRLVGADARVASVLVSGARVGPLLSSGADNDARSWVVGLSVR